MSERIAGELLKGHLPMLVLAILDGQPRHGYEIAKMLAKLSSGALDIGQGTIYPLLYNLEEEGLVRSKVAKVAGRERRVYYLTSSGRKSLAGRKKTWRDFQRTISAVLGSDNSKGPSHEPI